MKKIALFCLQWGIVILWIAGMLYVGYVLNHFITKYW